MKGAHIMLNKKSVDDINVKGQREFVVTSTYHYRMEKSQTKTV
jgi:hypothetical protein